MPTVQRNALYDIPVTPGVRFTQPTVLNARVEWEGRVYDILIRSMSQDSELDQNGIHRRPMNIIGVVTREGHVPTGAAGQGRIMITHGGFTDIMNISRMNWSLDHGVTTLEVRAYPTERRSTGPLLDDQGNSVDPNSGLTWDEMALRRPGESNAEARSRGEQALAEIRNELAGIRQGAEREPNLREVWAD